MLKKIRSKSAKARDQARATQDDGPTMDFFRPNIVRVRDLSRGAFSPASFLFDRPGRSLSSLYLDL